MYQNLKLLDISLAAAIYTVYASPITTVQEKPCDQVESAINSVILMKINSLNSGFNVSTHMLVEKENETQKGH